MNHVRLHSVCSGLVVRLLLTGHPNGARVVDLLRLLELAEAELTTETGFSLRERLTIARQLFAEKKNGYDGGRERVGTDEEGINLQKVRIEWSVSSMWDR